MKFNLIFIFLTFFALQTQSQSIRINEVMSSNGGIILDSDGDSPDWIEFYNSGNEVVNLNGYGLSDKKDELFQWIFPDFKIGPKEYLLVYASGKDRREIPLYWNTIINRGDTWNYIVPVSEPATNWRYDTFNDSGWNTGISGFGYGDNDDATVLSGVKSIFLRKKFTISDVAEVRQLIFHMDYDDGFVAYINGKEIARSQMTGKGDFPKYDEFASGLHEALIYQNLSPEKFEIEVPASFLKNGENVLAVQVHNDNAGSSDFTAIPFLTVGTSKKPISQRIADILDLGQHELHTNFKISADGESVYLTSPSGAIADSVQVPELILNSSYGRRPDVSDSWAMYIISTPGEQNPENSVSSENVGVPIFSKAGNVSSGGLNLTITAPNPLDTIYYTLNGSEPTIFSYRVDKEFEIRSSQVIRARIIKSGVIPGKVVTNSYIVSENKKLPVVSFSMNPADLWDYYTGIYVSGPNAETKIPNFGANFWMDWEKACHFELLENSGEKVIDVDAGVKIYGNWSRAHAQKSMALYCRKSYGSERMNYKLFKERPFGEFKDLVFRNSGNDWNETMFRDGLMTGLTRGLDVDYLAFRPSVCYLNGEYWGIINIREKINEHFIASNHDVDPDDVILLENNGNVILGNGDDWWKMYSFIQNNSLSIASNYEQVVSQIDLNNYLNYTVSEIFYANHDWPANNIKYWKTTDPGSRWRWIMFDTDFGMGIWWTPASKNSLEIVTATNGTEWHNLPWSTLMLRRLLENTGFRNQFVNRFADLMNSTFLPENVNQAIDEKKNQILDEMSRHLSRWNGGSLNDWMARVNYMKTFAADRPANVFSHIRAKFNFQWPQIITVRAEDLKGSVQINSLKLNQFPWKGVYFPDVPVTLTAVPKAGFRFLKWEGIATNSNLQTITVSPKSGLDLTAVFETDGSHYDDIVINEISFNNNAPQDPGDWIELNNKGQFDIDLSGWKFTDSDPNHQFIFAAGTIIRANGYLVVCSNPDKMKSVFGDVKNLLEPFAFSFGLSNTVDEVKLYSKENQLIDEVSYGNDEPWPTFNFDELWSLELNNPASENNSGTNWGISKDRGTPGLHNALFIPSANNDLKIEAMQPRLLQNYPNPFSDGTYIEFKLLNPDQYKISILDVEGRIVRILNDQNNFSSIHNLYWDGTDNSGKKVASGIYFYRLESEGFSEMKRMVKL